MLAMLDVTSAHRAAASVRLDQSRAVLALSRTLSLLAPGEPEQCRNRNLLLKRMILKSSRRNRKRKRRRKRRTRNAQMQERRNGRKRQTVMKTNQATTMTTVMVAKMRKNVRMTPHGPMQMEMVARCMQLTSNPKLFLVRKHAITERARRGHIAAAHAILAQQFIPRPLAETKSA